MTMTTKPTSDFDRTANLRDAAEESLQQVLDENALRVEGDGFVIQRPMLASLEKERAAANLRLAGLQHERDTGEPPLTALFGSMDQSAGW